MKVFLDPAQKQTLKKYLTPYKIVEQQEKKIAELEKINKKYLSFINFSKIELEFKKRVLKI